MATIRGGDRVRAHPQGPTARKPCYPRQSHLVLGALASAVPCARLHARLVLTEWDLAHLADDCELIVSEMITNAVDASIALPDRPPVALRLLADGTSLVIEVWDRSPLDVEPREVGADAECGRGLTVVAALSDHWGWERTGDGRKVVWAELATAAGSR